MVMLLKFSAIDAAVLANCVQSMWYDPDLIGNLSTNSKIDNFSKIQELTIFQKIPKARLRKHNYPTPMAA